MSFGEDRKEDGPIYAVIDSNTFFGGNVPMNYPSRVQVDIRNLRETLMQAIHDHRREYDIEYSKKKSPKHGKGRGGRRRRGPRGGGRGGSNSISVH